MKQKLENGLFCNSSNVPELVDLNTVKGQGAAFKGEAHCIAHIILTELLNIKKHLVKKFI